MVEKEEDLKSWKMGKREKAENTSQSSCSLAKDRKEGEAVSKLERKSKEGGCKIGTENLNSLSLSSPFLCLFCLFVSPFLPS